MVQEIFLQPGVIAASASLAAAGADIRRGWLDDLDSLRNGTGVCAKRVTLA
jgi:hypothetical protein